MNLIEELRWRGMIQDIMPGTEDQLQKEITTGYIGFDPTADSLHIGSLVPIMILVHLQKAGHKSIALVGGATGMVGDPSGKSEERNLLSEDTLAYNVTGIQKQLARFLDFDPSKPNAAEIVNNYDWFKNFSFLDFIRDVGKHITVNYMMAKESVKKRLEGDNGMSFTEFTYQLVQGYDFYWLNKHKNAKLQVGGSDQWGNIVTGTELIRRKAGGEAFAFTCPLITKSDGGKFGKTEKGNVWLDITKTSGFQFYQFWLNAIDEDAKKWIRIFTFLPKDEIETIIMAHEEYPNARKLQKKLAEEVTIFVHGINVWKKAVSDSEKIFNTFSTTTTTTTTTTRAPITSESFTLEDLEAFEGLLRFDYALEKIKAGTDVISFLAETGIFSSKGEARKMIQNGGVSINRNKVTDVSMTLRESLLLHQQYLFIQKGKKNYYLVKAV